MIFFEVLLSFFFTLAICLITFLSFYLFLRKTWRREYVKWDMMIDLLLRKAIFFHEDNAGQLASIPVTRRLKANLRNKRFCKQFVKKIIAAKRNMSGRHGENLRHLYIQLGLDKKALRLLESRKWHVRAYAIQQIGTMGLKEQLTRIYRYTNNKNDLVRIEAQIAVLNLFGFEGLRFLDIISYQMTEWQQIRLLKELSTVPQAELTGIDKWLTSGNPSVVIFALKLVRNYHRYELYENTVSCLDHGDASVRKQAISTLTEIYTESTSEELLSRFDSETYKNQIAIMNAIAVIGGVQNVSTLLGYLGAEKHEMKFAVARALVNGSAIGLECLINDSRSTTYPLRDMIPQLKSEIKW
ncbi:HEAT repeat domain-containing protein [Pedobacter kyonggii]|uniref:HEAT repeat domain-containing protein n=1 Tax=Pedobacter kyonggii TaxID=1926871 RepID=A0A4Q9HGR1_9SPHI|nr:hypothetical protein [Pedobacter kyonggii]TBO44428.1 hypothetical protein EYS08_03725 [Pedobacter kyonggii]